MYNVIYLIFFQSETMKPKFAALKFLFLYNLLIMFSSITHQFNSLSYFYISLTVYHNKGVYDTTVKAQQNVNLMKISTK